MSADSRADGGKSSEILVSVTPEGYFVIDFELSRFSTWTLKFAATSAVRTAGPRRPSAPRRVTVLIAMLATKLMLLDQSLVWRLDFDFFANYSVLQIDERNN